MNAPCTMGVGCDEYGVCYANAHGQPRQCPHYVAPTVSEIACVLRDVLNTSGARGTYHAMKHYDAVVAAETLLARIEGEIK
jgi:hypothetical protein